MARHKYGSAIIVRGAEVLGIFTTTDALRALDTILTGGTRKAAKPAARKAAKKKASTRRSTSKTARKGSGQTARRLRR